MRTKFKGYYRPTEVEFSELWKNCIFVFDTNTLLNVYRYSEKTRESFLNILEKVKDRIWIPYQVGYEYQENRLEVISQQMELYDAIKKELNDTIQKIKNLLDGRKKHPLIDTNELIETLRKSFLIVEAYVEGVKSKHPDFIESDDLRERVTDLFDNRVGDQYSEDELGKKLKEGEARYKQQIPPGYKDASKDDAKKFGDFIIWSQVIDFARAEKKPLIFITADVKEDWWFIHKGKTIGPRPELIQEMTMQAGIAFYMYTPDQFTAYAEKFLKLQDQKEAIKEIVDIREKDLESYRKSEVVENIIQEQQRRSNSATAAQYALESVLRKNISWIKISKILRQEMANDSDNPLNVSRLLNELIATGDGSSLIDTSKMLNELITNSDIMSLSDTRELLWQAIARGDLQPTTPSRTLLDSSTIQPTTANQNHFRTDQTEEMKTKNLSSSTDNEQNSIDIKKEKNASKKNPKSKKSDSQT